MTLPAIHQTLQQTDRGLRQTITLMPGKHLVISGLLVTRARRRGGCGHQTLSFSPSSPKLCSPPSDRQATPLPGEKRCPMGVLAVAKAVTRKPCRLGDHRDAQDHRNWSVVRGAVPAPGEGDETHEAEVTVNALLCVIPRNPEGPAPPREYHSVCLCSRPCWGRPGSLSAQLPWAASPGTRAAGCWA